MFLKLFYPLVYYSFITISLQHFSQLTARSSSYTRRVLMNIQETFAKGHCCISLSSLPRAAIGNIFCTSGADC